jgi:hypothetical protein
MRYDQNAHPCCLGVTAALATVLLLTPLTHAAPSPDSVSGAQNSAALSIAGAAAMSGAVSVATAPPAAPVQPAVSKRSMTPEERQHVMMLLILHEGSRRPLGSLR